MVIVTPQVVIVTPPGLFPKLPTTNVGFDPKGYLAVPGDIFVCYNWGFTGVCWVEVKDTVQHPAIQDSPSPTSEGHQRLG